MTAVFTLLCLVSSVPRLVKPLNNDDDRCSSHHNWLIKFMNLKTDFIQCLREIFFLFLQRWPSGRTVVFNSYSIQQNLNFTAQNWVKSGFCSFHQAIFIIPMTNILNSLVSNILRKKQMILQKRFQQIVLVRS